MTDPIEEPVDPEDPALWPDEYTTGTRYHLDLDTSIVYRANDDGDWEVIGTIPGTGGSDGHAPSKVLNLVLTPLVVYGADGITFESVAIHATWDPVPETDVIGYETQFDAYDGSFAVYTTLWSGGTETMLHDAFQGNVYYARVRAYDSEGLVGPWSDVATTTSLDDGTAPAIPSDVDIIPGYKLIAVQWTVSSEPDLDRYEVQWAPEAYSTAVPPVALGTPDTNVAEVLVVYGSSVIIAGLGVGLRYFARVRSIDTSGQTTLPGDPAHLPLPIPDGAVDAATNPDIGWSAWTDDPTDVTLLVGSSDLAVHALAAQFVNTGVLDANRVNTGTLTLGKVLTSGGTKVGIYVYDSNSRFIGWWNETGMLMVNPANTKEAMRLNSGRLEFTLEFAGFASAPNPPPASAMEATVWTTAITPRGINAEAITFGTARAGHNILPNSGFELQAFSITAESSTTWDLTAQWGLASGGINLDTSTGDLKLAAL